MNQYNKIAAMMRKASGVDKLELLKQLARLRAFHGIANKPANMDGWAARNNTIKGK